jgi:hypothetical protein
MQTWLTLNSQRSDYLCFTRALIKGGTATASIFLLNIHKLLGLPGGEGIPCVFLVQEGSFRENGSGAGGCRAALRHQDLFL